MFIRLIDAILSADVLLIWAGLTFIVCGLCWIWGFESGDNLARQKNCDLCKAKTDLDKAYADYGKAVWKAVHGNEQED